MKFIYQPRAPLEKFGQIVYNLLVENFSSTYYVGGMVRDLLLGRKVSDIDIATSAEPSKVAHILRKNKVAYNDSNRNFGIVKAARGALNIEIATLRKDLPGHGRYPKIKFTKSLKEDSQRRDFSINALYLSPKLSEIKDYHKGLKDLENKILRFIGDPQIRIKEDPLRIVRALRFALVLNFELHAGTKRALIENFVLVHTLTKRKIDSEVLKIPDPLLQLKLKKLLVDKNYLTLV